MSLYSDLAERAFTWGRIFGDETRNIYREALEELANKHKQIEELQDEQEHAQRGQGA